MICCTRFIFLQAGEEKSRRLVCTVLARRRWVFPMRVGYVGGASALDAGVLTGMFVDILAWKYHRCVRHSPSGR